MNLSQSKFDLKIFTWHKSIDTQPPPHFLKEPWKEFIVYDGTPSHMLTEEVSWNVFVLCFCSVVSISNLPVLCACSRDSLSCWIFQVKYNLINMLNTQAVLCCAYLVRTLLSVLHWLFPMDCSRSFCVHANTHGKTAFSKRHTDYMSLSLHLSFIFTLLIFNIHRWELDKLAVLTFSMWVLCF